MTSKPISLTHNFQFVGGNIALDFVNTVGNRLGVSRDYFTSPPEFMRWARLGGLLGDWDKITLKGSDWNRLLEIREEMYRIFKKLADNKPLRPPDIERLNMRMAEVASKQQVRMEKGRFALIWNTRRNDPDRIIGPILQSAVDLLTSGSFRRIRECADENCGWLFLDRSQTGKRKWCSMNDCGNRDKVRRYYRRKARVRLASPN